MPYAIKERVKDTTTTTGTGDITLAGSAPSGFRTFASAYSTNDLMPYCIEGGGQWEVGIGKLTASTTLQRLAVVDGSSGAATAVSFSAGTKNVFVSPLAANVDGVERTAFGDGSDNDATISSGNTDLGRDMYYKNLTISGTGSIRCFGYQIHVSEVLDLSNAPANAIQAAGNVAGNASSSSGGSGAAGLGQTLSNRNFTSTDAGNTGGAGATGAGAQASAPSAGASSSCARRASRG